MGGASGGSRCVVREAVNVLAAKGLVVSRPKTGTRVRPPEQWNLLDPDVLAWRQEGLPRGVLLGKLTEVRLIIEPARRDPVDGEAQARPRVQPWLAARVRDRVPAEAVAL